MADENLVELEIGAFMGPHIKRARILLVAVGLLYAIAGYYDYSMVADAQRAIERFAEGVSSPQLDAFRHAIMLAYVLTISAIVAGIANIALAAIAGVKTMPAFYAAAAIFIAQTLIQLYISGGVVLTSLVWWATAIVLSLGFFAALKAERLRAQAKLAPGTVAA
jgi:hypothetical protein